MAALVGFPVMADDDGSGQVGTPYNAAFASSALAAINAEVASGTNPAVTTKSIIDEVVAARGNLASLSLRLANVIDANGNFIPPATIPTTANIQASLPSNVNLIENDDFIIWSQGDASAPDGYILSGAGAAVARTGVGQGDVTVGYVGIIGNPALNWACKITSGGAAVGVLQYPLLPLGNSTPAGLKGIPLSMGAWVNASAVNSARLQYTDGNQTINSSYHPGDGAWHWLALQVAATNPSAIGAPKLALRVEAFTTSVYTDGWSCIFGTVPLTAWVPCPKIYKTYSWILAGNTTIGNRQFVVIPQKACIFTGIVGRFETPGTVSGNTSYFFKIWDGAAWTGWTAAALAVPFGNVVFAQQPGYAAGVGAGSYKQACCSGFLTTTAASSGAMPATAGIMWEMDTTGVAGTVGANVAFSLRAMEYAGALQSLLATQIN